MNDQVSPCMSVKDYLYHMKMEAAQIMIPVSAHDFTQYVVHKSRTISSFTVEFEAMK